MNYFRRRSKTSGKLCCHLYSSNNRVRYCWKDQNTKVPKPHYCIIHFFHRQQEFWDQKGCQRFYDFQAWPVSDCRFQILKGSSPRYCDRTILSLSRRQISFIEKNLTFREGGSRRNGPILLIAELDLSLIIMLIPSSDEIWHSLREL